MYKVINKLFDNSDNFLPTDMIHKRIASGLKHNLAIFYHKSTMILDAYPIYYFKPFIYCFISTKAKEDEIIPCLAGWGNNSSK